MQETTNANKELDSKARRTNPIHIAANQRLGPASAEALRDAQMSLVRAEQTLYNLVQASQAANGPLAQAGFGFGAPQAFTTGFAPGFAPGFGPSALHAPAAFGVPSASTIQTPNGLAYGLPATAWGQPAPWAQASTAVPSWAPLAPGLATPILAPGFAPGFPAAAFAPMASRSPVSGIIACDISDEGKQFVCSLDLPGLRADQVDLFCTEQAIVVGAYRDAEADGVGLVQSERTTSAQRTVTLPNEIVPTGVKATLSNGVLTVVLPKANPTEGARRVKVQG